MSQPPAPPPPSHPRNILKRFAADLIALSHWQKVVLAIAVLAAGLGWLSPGSAEPAPNPPPTIHQSEISSATQPTISSTPWISRVGISVILGFIVGWITRAFLKITALIAFLFAGLLGTLSYFHIMNVDMTTAADKDYHDASAWVTDQTHRLEKSVLAHIPSGVAGFGGVFMGIRRKKRIWEL